MGAYVEDAIGALSQPEKDGRRLWLVFLLPENLIDQIIITVRAKDERATIGQGVPYKPDIREMFGDRIASAREDSGELP